MRDAQIRRRRVVLALLVCASLVLLTASFGSTDSGPLHPVRTVVMTVLGPLETGASAVFKPVRDLFGWFGSTLDAKDQAVRLKRERDALRKQVVDGRAALAQNNELRGLLGLGRRLGLNDYGPVAATVIGRSPNVWYSNVQVDAGTDDGVRVDQPAVDGDGLVGTVSAVTPGTAVITLITDRTAGVSAKLLTGRGDRGTVVAADGDPGMLTMLLLSPKASAAVGSLVVTAGVRTGPLATLFPPDIPVGEVTAVDPDRVQRDGAISVKPIADLDHLDHLLILTGSATRIGATR